MRSVKILTYWVFLILFISCSKPGPSQTPYGTQPGSFRYDYVPSPSDWDHGLYATGFSASKGSFFFDFVYSDAMVRSRSGGVSIDITNKLQHDMRTATKATLTYRLFASGFQSNSTLSVFANSFLLSRRNLIVGLPESLDLPQSVFKEAPVTIKFTFLLPRADPPAVFTATIAVTDISLSASN